jgi:indole-3-glycerol phosphate synthase
MTILDTINQRKREEIIKAKEETSLEELQHSLLFGRKTNSLKAALTKSGSSGIIAEFKRKSPSKGYIKEGADVRSVSVGYALSGAAGMSVLTDSDYFGGSKEDLISAREANPLLPLLRKDFMLDIYQLYEAKAWGADVILLIAASLSPGKITELSTVAHQLDLEVLLEVHSLEELKKSSLDHVDIVGVNNRNLKNFNESTIQPSLDLISEIPNDKVKISESCISDPNTLLELRQAGYQGFLIGESFMKTEDPAASLKKYIQESSR